MIEQLIAKDTEEHKSKVVPNLFGYQNPNVDAIDASVEVYNEKFNLNMDILKIYSQETENIEKLVKHAELGLQ